MPDDKISKLIEEKTYKRIAAALERIADALEKQNAGMKITSVFDGTILVEKIAARVNPRFIPEDSNGPCAPGPNQKCSL